MLQIDQAVARWNWRANERPPTMIKHFILLDGVGSFPVMERKAWALAISGEYDGTS